jgi:hypothetical protein
VSEGPWGLPWWWWQVLTKKLMPRHVEPLLLMMAMNVCEILQSISSDPARMQGMDEELLSDLTELMNVLFEQHPLRLLMVASPQQMVTLFAQYTFNLPNLRLMRRALTGWMSLVDFFTGAELDEGPSPAVQAMVQGLGDFFPVLGSSLLQKALFVTNGEALRELDDQSQARDLVT